MLTKVSYKAVGISSADRRDNLIAIIIIGRRRTAKTRPENEETTNHSWTASPKSRCRSLVFPQKTGRKGLDAVRSSPCSRNYKIGGICRKEGRPTNTGCQNIPTQHRLSSVTES